MNILGTTNIFQKNTYLSPQVKKYPIAETPADSFTKSVTSPNFKANKARVINKAFQKSANGHQIMGLISFVIGGTALGETLTEKNITDFLSGIFDKNESVQDTPNQEIQELKKENEGLKKTVSNLEKQVKELILALSGKKQKQTKQKAEVPDNKEEDLTEVKFPPRRGRLSEEQTKLKTIVESLKVKKETAEKLTAVCAELLRKDTNKNFDKKSMTENLSSDLSKGKYIDKIVDKYYNDLNLSAEQKPESASAGQGSSVLGDSNSEGSAQTDKTKEEGDDGGKSSTDGTGSNNAKKINPGEKYRPRAYNISVETGEYSLESDDGKTFLYKIPETIHRNPKTNLSNLFSRFKEKYSEYTQRKATEEGIEPEKINWIQKRSVSENVRKQDVIDEINKYKTSGKYCRYANIKRSNAERVAEIINSDRRFQQSFSLHGSMRFIERFVDLSNDDSLEERTSHALDVLFDTIQASVTKGITLGKYDEKHNFGHYNPANYEMRTGTSVIIPEEYFSDEAWDLFGAYPLKIGVCQENSRNKNALICTIFPAGT